MNILLWALQIILALKFLSVAYSHGLRPDPAKMERGNRRFGAAARPLLVVIAFAVLLCALSLIVPAVTGMASWLVPWSAAILAALMLGAIGFHIACRDDPKIWASLVLFLLAALLAYGRWLIAPL